LWLNHKLDEDTAWEAHNAIKEALKIKDEPVAWGMEKDGVILDVICPDEHEREEGEYTIPVYTQPQRTWVGLTDEEKAQFVVAYYPSNWDRKTAVSLMSDYEKYLKEKNNAI